MKTDVIHISNELKDKQEALQLAEHFAAYNTIAGKDAMHIRLLTEEAVNLVHGIVNQFEGSLWLESEQTSKGLLCRICVSADTEVSDGQERRLLGVSSSGKNEDAKGIVGKIRQFMRWSIQRSDQDDAIVRSWFNHGLEPTGDSQLWSLQTYRQNMKAENQMEDDELEKSIITQIADEVKVGILAQKAEIIIEKYL